MLKIDLRILEFRGFTEREHGDNIDSRYLLSVIACRLSHLTHDHMLLSEQSISR